MWRGDWITQDLFNMETFRRCSRIEFRFIRELHNYLDETPLGTHWVDALLNRDGLSLEMKFSQFSWRADGLPGPLCDQNVYIIMRKAMFHQCTSGLLSPSIDGCFGWFKLELRHSPTPAFPMKAYEDAYKIPVTEEEKEDLAQSSSSFCATGGNS